VTPATEPFRLAGRRIWVAGHRGMVGSALLRRLSATGCEVVTAGRDRVDLRRQTELEAWLAEARPAVVIVAAATVGGILANATRPAEFLYDNLAIEANIVEASRRAGVAKLLLLGSSCIYPKLAPQPLREDCMLTGLLEPTNELATGLRAVLEQMEAILERQGVRRIGAPGERFDPELHEAVGVQEKDEVPDRTILEVARSGFGSGDRLLRPAQVVVSHRPEGDSRQGEVED